MTHVQPYIIIFCICICWRKSYTRLQRTPGKVWYMFVNLGDSSLIHKTKFRRVYCIHAIINPFNCTFVVCFYTAYTGRDVYWKGVWDLYFSVEIYNGVTTFTQFDIVTSCIKSVCTDTTSVLLPNLHTTLCIFSVYNMYFYVCCVQYTCHYIKGKDVYYVNVYMYLW